MKNFYFKKKSENESKIDKFKKTIIRSVTNNITSVSPKLSEKLATKILCRPYSLRSYSLRTNIQPTQHKIKTKLGNVILYKFESKLNVKHIFLSHGWSDSSIRFTRLINFLTSKGITVWSLDHIGHGKSEGKVAHLFGFIEGMTKSLEFLNSQNIEIDAIIGHSMGALATLNLPDNIHQNKKVILISMPTKFFESMFYKITSLGISKSTLENLLNRVSKQYQRSWQDLSPDQNTHKIKGNFYFIHDKTDQVCSYENLTNLLQNSPSQLDSTNKLGHLMILKNEEVFEKIHTYLMKT